MSVELAYTLRYARCRGDVLLCGIQEGDLNIPPSEAGSASGLSAIGIRADDSLTMKVRRDNSESSSFGAFFGRANKLTLRS